MTQREAFEAWAKSQNLDPDHKERDAWGRDVYSPHIHSMWCGWQAAQAQAATFNDVPQLQVAYIKGLDAGFEPPFTPLSLQPAHDAATIDLLNDKVMRQQDVMRLALEALNSCTPGDWSTGHVIDPYFDEKMADAAIAALEGSLDHA